jgi:pSer/pThr/pTyr-binding forkhead associated (FHA) protein
MEGGHPLAQDPFGPPQYGQAPPAPPMMGGPPPPPPPPQPQAEAPKGDAPARRALAGFLVSYQDDEFGKFWPLWQGKNSIGRADTGARVEIEIAHGTTSTHHATIECDPQRFLLSDLGSTNGTFHNEEAIGFQGKRDLRDGDKIRFGGYSVMVVNVVSRT